METVQDLLAPERDNISIVEDPKTGDVSLPGATLVEIRDPRSFLELLQIGEANRFAANTKLNTESSRSHAILLVKHPTPQFACRNLVSNKGFYNRFVVKRAEIGAACL